MTLPLLPLLTLLARAGTSAPEIDVGDLARGPEACPSRTQIADAFENHMPGILARVGRELDPNVLHLGLAISAAGVAHVTLTDATGALQLERDLDLPRPEAPAAPPPGPPAPAAPRDRSADCAAFADTLALIVERYMRHIGYHEPPPPALVPPPEPPPPAPPPPPPGPRALLGVGTSIRPPWGAPGRVEPELTAEVRFGDWSLTTTGAAALPSARTIPMTSGGGTFTFWALSARVALGRVVPLGERLVLIPAIGAGADLVRARTTGLGQTRQSSALEPVAEAGASLVWLVTRRFWVGGHLLGGLDLRPEEFYVDVDPPQPPLTLLMTPRGYVRAGIDFGVTFGKN